MQLESIKSKVKEAFSNVDSSEYLQERVDYSKRKHLHDYYKDKSISDVTFGEWKLEKEQSINTNASSNEEFMAIGIFLIALDEAEKIS